LENTIFLVGTIASTFGNRGDLKIYPFITPPEILLELRSIFIEDSSGNKQEFTVLRSKKHKNIFIFTLEGVDTMNVAEDLRGLSIYVPGLDFKELKKNEYFYHDLEGLDAYSESGDLIGKVDHIIKSGNDILVIKDENGKETMVPFVDELVPEVNLKEKTITVNAIDGLV